MKKNSQIHLFVETDLKNKLERQAKEEGIALSELCRGKLKETPKLDRIEMMLDKLTSKIK